MTKSAIAVPGFVDGHVRTVKIEGSLKKNIQSYKRLNEHGRHLGKF